VPPEPIASREARKRRVAERRAGPAVIVHRGASSFAPENTLEAYAAAMDLGADGCEVDVRRTADGVLVLFHDDMLDHLTNGFGTVRDWTYRELLELTPRQVYGTATRATRPPTFAALLALARDRAMLLHLDVKESDLESDIERMLDAADLWEHVVAINTETAPRLAKDPRVRLLRFKAPGLYEARLDVDPEAVKAALEKPGELIMVDDPRVAARVLHRTAALTVPPDLAALLNPAANPAKPPEREPPSGPSIPREALGKLPPDLSEEALLTILERSDPERLEPGATPSDEARRAGRILERAWAAQKLAERGRRDSRIVRALEAQIASRSMHKDWMYHGLDAALAARALGMLGAADSAPVLIEFFRRVDPALAKVVDPRWKENPLGWTDFRAKMYVLPALSDLRCSAAKAFLFEYLALDEKAALEIAPPLQEEATRALCRQELTRPDLEALLRHRLPVVRGTAILELLDHPDPSRDEVLRAVVPWALELPRSPSESATLSGSVIDADTGLPSPCTVTIVDSSGRTILESDSLRTGFRCDGSFKKRLLAGRTRVVVSRGPETRAVEREIELSTDADAAMEIKLERIVDLRKRGWFAGDSHVHMLHGERAIPVSFDDVARAAKAEDLAFLSLAQDWAIDDPTPEKLSAELSARSSSTCRLTWNLEAPKNYYQGDATRCLGHCWFVGARGRTAGGDDVIRLLAAASAHDYQSEKPTFANFESHRMIHEQGGAVFYTHPARWWSGAWGGQGIYPRRENVRVSNMAVELPLDTLIGPTFDGVDVMTTEGEHEAGELAFKLWCLLVNHGYRMTATASSDACFDRPGGAVPGSVRTYVRLNGDFSLEAVPQAMARGAVFATSGPLLLASVASRPPGSVFPADGTARTLEVEAWASGTDRKGLTRLELYRNGELLKTTELSPPVRSLRTSFPIGDSSSAWYCLRIAGGERRERAVSGAFFFDKDPYRPPKAVLARVNVELSDAKTGAAIAGEVTDVFYSATQARRGTAHSIPREGAVIEISGEARLEAVAAGYEAKTLSPFLDHAPLLDFILSLTAEDLVRWETFERVRALLGEVRLTFQLKKRE